MPKLVIQVSDLLLLLLAWVFIVIRRHLFLVTASRLLPSPFLRGIPLTGPIQFLQLAFASVDLCQCSCVYEQFLPNNHFRLSVGFKVSRLSMATSRERSELSALCCCPQVNKIKTPKQIDELIEIESDTGTWYRRCFVRIRTELYGVSTHCITTCMSTSVIRGWSKRD